MAKFWLATFEPLARRAPSSPVPVLSAQPKPYAIEVLEEKGELAVLFSTVDDPAAPKEFHCRIGFANGSKSCNVWRDRGFPLMDAMITFGEQGLRVRSPAFLTEQELEYDAELITIAGAMFGDGTGIAGKPLKVSYVQSQNAPDFAFPATWIRRRQVSWSTTREDVTEVPPTKLKLTATSPRLPDLDPFKKGPATPYAVWTGSIDMPKWPPAFEAAERANRIEAFGVPAFRFEDVEVLGFRIDLDRHSAHSAAKNAEIDRKLAAMIEQLNFHLEPSASDRASAGTASDFRYRPATRTVMLELLRYGKMKLKEPWLTLGTNDFQSQHELLVRLLVGRVDDDTTQAHDPATYVPTLFVDNPWSKTLGRNVQGFDKRMADFCVRDGPNRAALRPDGKLRAGGSARELASIREIHLSDNTVKRPSGIPLLLLDCPFEDYHSWDDDFEEIDFNLALCTSSFSPTRWRQSDFLDVEFRRSFARSAISGTPNSIRSLQASPVGETLLREAWKEEATWITGTFIVDDGAQIARPNFIVGLELFAQHSAPKAWKDLCKLLDIDQGESGRISLGPGNWYRMRCSMDLIVDNGLD